MTRLLLVEDELALARAVATGLRDEGYVVDHAPDGDAALAGAASGLHDAMILDLRLPGRDGLSVLRALRGHGSALPVLVVTACDSTREVVAGLDAGADDYVTKPFAFVELLARLRALLRRAAAAAPGAAGRLRAADLELDPASRRAFRAGRDLGLSNLEFRLLEHLLRHAGRVQSRGRLAATLWDTEVEPESNALEVHVSNLRRKVDRDAPRLIHTRRGVGYVLEVPA